MKLQRLMRQRATLPLLFVLFLGTALSGPCLHAQTFTAPTVFTNGTFSNPLYWNLGAGPVPGSSASLALTMQTYGSGTTTINNDLNLTLNTLNLFNNRTGALTLGASLGGTFAFTGAAKINLLGTGSNIITMSAPIVLGSTATGLTFDGAGPHGVTFSSVISSNTSAPVTIATDAGIANTGVVSFTGANTFAGGVVLDSGSLALGNARALGDRTNTLTVNGGSLRAPTTGSALTVSNNVALNTDLSYHTGTFNISLAGVVSGLSGVTASPTNSALAGLVLSGVNTYSGATTVRGFDHAAGGGDVAALLSVAGASGSIISTSGIDVSAGGRLQLNYNSGHSAANTRVSGSTGITTTGGFVEVIGNNGLVTQSLGSMTLGGLTTILAATNGAGTAAAGAATEVTIANLARGAGDTVTFSGPNLGLNAVAAGLGAAQGNVILTQINSAAPSGALVGGGGAAGTANMSILPFALGDTANTAANYGAGTGFVTIGANGVRLLDTTTEYNTGNNFTTLPDATQNMRITAAITNPAAPVTVNSIFFANTARTLGGANLVTITSGALASNVAAATVSAPVQFGAGGTGEAIISVAGALATTNTMTISGNLTAASLTKSGHGSLVISSATTTMSGPITINGGDISVNAVSRLGSPTSITVNGQSYDFSRAGMIFTHTTGTQTLTTPITINSGAMSINVPTGASTLNLNSDISGPGTLRLENSGTKILGGTNSYSGGTILGGGTVQIDSDARFGAAGGYLDFVALNTLRLTGPWTSSRPISMTLSTTLDTQANAATLSGPISNTSTTFTKVGSGTLTITGGNNGYASGLVLGNTTTQGGSILLTGPGALDAASLTIGPNAGGVAGTYTFDISGVTDHDPTDGSSTPWRSLAALNTGTGFTQAHTVQLGSSGLAPVDLRVTTGSFGGTAGVIAGFGDFVKVGSGSTFTFNGTANTFTGDVEIRGGLLAFSNDAQVGNVANPIVLAGGTLNPTATLSTARAITLGPTPQPLRTSAATGETLVNAFDTGANGLTLNGALSGTGGFNKTGSGLLTLGVANSYTGDAQVSQGTLRFTADNQLGGSGARVRLSGGTLQFNGGAATSLTHALVLTSNSTLDTSNIVGGSLDIAAPMIAATNMTLTKIGSNAASITADNAGFLGTLAIGNGAAATGNVTLSGAGQLQRAIVTLNASSGATFSISGLARDIGSLGSATANTFATGTTVALGSGGHLTTGFRNLNVTWLGNITGSGGASVSLVGTGSTTIQSTANTFNGGFNLMSSSSDVTLSALGALPALSHITIGAWSRGSFVNSGPALTLTNVATNHGNRIDDTQAIYSNAGTLVFSSNAGVTSTESISSLHGAGMTTVTMTTGGILDFTDVTNALTRVNRGTFLFRGGNDQFGLTAGSATFASMTFANISTPDLVGGGGVGGSSNMSILPYAVGGISVTDAGSRFVSYDGFGIRTIDPSTEMHSHIDTTAFSNAADVNVRVANTALTTTTIGGGTDRTMNSLMLDGLANAARIASASTERLIVTSGTILSLTDQIYAANATDTAGERQGIQAAELRTGAGNTRELNVFTTSGDLDIGAKITTSGGLTKSGGANLYLTNNANTYTGATTINAGRLVIDDLGALGGSTSLVIGGGYLHYRGADATLTGFTVTAAGGAAAGLGGSAGFDVSGGTTLTIPAGAVSGNGGIMKDGRGVLVLQGTNTNSGATVIAGGALAITDAAALGTHSRVVFTESAYNSNGGATLRFDAPMTLAKDFITNTSSATVGIGFDTNGNNITLSGIISGTTGTRGVLKIGDGNLTLTGAQQYTGATEVFGGTLTLADANGSIFPSTSGNGFTGWDGVLIGHGAKLVLDNTATNNNNRLYDNWEAAYNTSTTAQGGILVRDGELKILGNAAVATNERVNRVALQSGVVTLVNSGQNVTLTSAQVGANVIPGAALIRGDNLGATPSATSTNWFAYDMGGGTGIGGVGGAAGAGGAAGTPFVNIFAGVMGDTSSTGVGTDLVTYSADVGFRTLTSGEYTTTIPADNFLTSRAPNALVSGATTVNSNALVTALKLTTGGVLSGSGAPRLAQGTVLATGNATISTPVLGAGNTSSGYSFLVPGSGVTLGVSSMLVGTTGSIFLPALTKFGEGTLEISGRVTGSGEVDVAQGTLRLVGAGASFNPVGGTVSVARGATFDLGGQDRIISMLDTNSDQAYYARDRVTDGTVALGANRLTLYSEDIDTQFSGNITGAGGVTKAFMSRGYTTFNTPQSYTGSTVINGGTLALWGNGTLASTQIEIRGGALEFDDFSDRAFAGGFVPNRIGASVPITIAGGYLNVFETTDKPVSINLGAVALEGTAFIDSFHTLTLANLSRAAGHGTLSIFAADLGLAPSATGNTRVFLTQIEGGAPAAALIGGGGAVGTTTQSILPWAFDGDTFLTYGVNGLRGLSLTEYETDALDTPSSSSSNIRAATAQTLTAARTVNALYISGAAANISGAFDLTLGSGGLSFGDTATVGVNNLLTGAGNTRELVINANSISATINSVISTSGGVTVFGGADVTLGGVNTFTGGLNINQGTVLFTNDNQLGAPGGAVRFGGTTESATALLTYTGSTAVPLEFNRPLVTTSYGTLAGQGIHIWRVNGVISGSGAMQYDVASGTNPPIFEINAVNTYTGATFWDNGHLYINGDSAFGNGGDLILSAASTSNIVLRNNWTTSRLVHAYVASAIQTNGYDATWNGQFIGNGAALTKNGYGSLILTDNASMNAGITVNAGALVLRDSGSLAAGTGTTVYTANNGGAITLDDTGAHHPDRLPDLGTNGGVVLGGGELKLLGSSSVRTEEVINDFTIGASATSTVTVAAGSGQASILRIRDTFTINAGASLWRGTNLGVSAPGTANTATVIMTEDNALQQGGVSGLAFLTGGGSAAGNPSVSIIRGAFGDTSASGLGTQLVTYDFDKGIRLLNPTTEYTTTLVNGSIVNDNIKADGTALSPANATTANALWLKDGGSYTGAGTLTLTASTILVSGTGNTVSGTISPGGSNALYIGGSGDLTFNTAASTTNGLYKMGAGTLTLNTANTNTSGTWLSGGTIALGNATALGAAQIRVQDAAIQNATGGPLTISNAIALNGVMTVSGAQDLTFSAAVTINNATREINVTNTGTTTITGLISNNQSLINYGLTKSGAGLLVLSNGGNTYDGPTTVSDGTLRADSNNAMGTAWSGTTILTGATLHLNNVNYSTAEALYLNGTGIGGGGALRNIGTSTYAGQITAQTNASIHSGGGTLTLTGGLIKDGTTLTLTGGGQINITTTGITGSSANSDLVVDGTTVIVSAASNYNGPTTVQNSGVLVANAEIDTTNVTVSSNSTLSGTGRVDSASGSFIIINGTLQVGDSTLGSPVASQLEIATAGAGSTVMGSTSTVLIDLFTNVGDNTAILASADRIKLFGTMNPTLGSTLVIGNPNSLTGFNDGDKWRIFDLSGGGSIADTFNLDYTSLGPLSPGLSGYFNPGTGIFSITSAVPEPGRALLLMAGLAPMLLSRRRPWRKVGR